MSTERLILTYGHAVMFSGLDYEVDVTHAKNEQALDDLIVNRKWVAHKYLVSGFDHIANRPTHKAVVKFADHRNAVEFKLRIEY